MIVECLGWGAPAEAFTRSRVQGVRDGGEVVRGPARSGPWKTVEDLELATLGWVHWHNTQRLHGYLGDIPPAEFEEAFYAGPTAADRLLGIK
ncbi:Mobile element protein [Microbacterium esteraromaticum]|uniref:Mobile element protein n=1 Tax=Microbacterium esteraromaticum TaxID=57043 RepID=A0A1R4KL12_9MICO|nr:Mobile element protein [Microbacterium esteraromaticum]